MLDPLGFLSGKFTNTQGRWSILEKESFSVVATLDRMHWLVATQDGFDIYTDHNNLIFLFYPPSIVPDMSQTTLWKFLRWAVKLSPYDYTCIHIKGEYIVWEDLLSRWTTVPEVIRRLVHIPELPSSSHDEFEWPSGKEIAY